MNTTPHLFGATTTADEVLDGVDLTGNRAVVTGGASGIGFETVKALAKAGADVTIAVRNLPAGNAAAEEIREKTGSGHIRAAYLDLSKPATLRRFAEDWVGPLNMLVNNAGIMATPLTRTPAGSELQFANNHLGHFILSTALHTALASAPEGARVVSVSSAGHQLSDVIFDDIMFERRAYDPWTAYGQSKTANILFAVSAAHRWEDDGIAVNAVHPGGIVTNLQRHMSREQILDMGWIDEEGTINPNLKTPAQGAATSTFAAASPLIAGTTGRYFEDVHEAAPFDPANPMVGVAPYALDAAAADRLWTLSHELTA